ncbi:class I SAM-dependent DNA methyltransferase [Reichenbachiella sp.]|uniref:class I SAM-dependent DNA methyltransferase n=1 Tax=Reichenbachiella sp. TaxID=2184521 RepID=UPI003B58BA4B
MNIAQIENNLQQLMKSFDRETFIYRLLRAYGLPKASITRLKKGNLNLSKIPGEISWKKKLVFKEEFEKDLHLTITELAHGIKYAQRFVVVTDYQTLLAIDTKTDEKLDIELKDLPKHYDFFLPWAGMEKAQHADENPADVKAAERMAKLFDEIKKDNPDNSPEFVHGLNVFLSRLLFCFFAEDTKIFKPGQFTKAISSHTQTDGSDLNQYMDKLFDVLNTPEKQREGLPVYLSEFPYVNGGLFEKKIQAPKFTRRSRQAIIDSGELDWSAINPDIFGSMMQAVITPEHRGGLGIHYTSVPNIMKVIEPLFLDDLYISFEKAQSNPKKLNELLYRLSKIKIFDPACGSGNFLIIAYKELRRLEIKIIRHLQELKQIASGFGAKTEQLTFIPKSQVDLAASFEVELFSRIQLNQFYGIELDDFAHEIAQLSLWLAEHQMNAEFKQEFGQSKPTLPLKDAGLIVHGNACRIDWEEVCPKEKNDEVYILGNPPYVGSTWQSKSQKNDMSNVFDSVKGHKKLDYISCWLYLSAKYISNNSSKSGLVATNSICQGEQVSLLWPNIIDLNVEIFFGHTSFNWSNNAKGKAGVTCVIIGLKSDLNYSSKYIFSNGHKTSVENINPYLISGRNVMIAKRSKPVSKLPEMVYGNKPVDGGNLLLTTNEKNEILKLYPNASKFFKRILGSQELIHSKERWCLWIEDGLKKEAEGIPPIRSRILSVKKLRLASKDSGANRMANKPHQFREMYCAKENSIILPAVSSENRDYIPLGYFDNNTVVTNRNFALYDPMPYVFGVITSKMHNVWVRAIAGRLRTDINYSSTLCYNAFPFPSISSQRISEITQCVFRILSEREKYPEKTLAELYDPDKMPDGLREAHHANDIVIEKCYRSRTFENDEERLEHLFKLYEKMIEEEGNRGTLFETQNKRRRKKHA